MSSITHLLPGDRDRIAQLSSLAVNLDAVVQELLERSGVEDAVLHGDEAVDHKLYGLLLGRLLRLRLAAQRLHGEGETRHTERPTRKRRRGRCEKEPNQQYHTFRGESIWALQLAALLPAMSMTNVAMLHIAHRTVVHPMELLVVWCGGPGTTQKSSKIVGNRFA